MKSRIPRNEDIGESASDALSFFCRHLVAIEGMWRPLDDANAKMKPFCYPGTILSLRNFWFFVTAGHTLKKIEEYLSDPRAEISHCAIRDGFGTEPKVVDPIRFNFTDTPSYWVYDEKDGLDFGVILLDSNQRALLEANNIAAISESHWHQKDALQLEKHFMIGIPDVLSDGTNVSITLMKVTEVERPSDVAPTNYPQFVGQLDDRIDIDIAGMSGGPVFGFKKDPPDRYWICALQSSWIRSRKLVFGCPIWVFASILERGFDFAIESIRQEANPPPS